MRGIFVMYDVGSCRNEGLTGRRCFIKWVRRYVSTYFSFSPPWECILSCLGNYLCLHTRWLGIRCQMVCWISEEAKRLESRKTPIAMIFCRVSLKRPVYLLIIRWQWHFLAGMQGPANHFSRFLTWWIRAVRRNVTAATAEYLAVGVGMCFCPWRVSIVHNM